VRVTRVVSRITVSPLQGCPQGCPALTCDKPLSASNLPSEAPRAFSLRVHLSHFLLVLPWLFVAPCAAPAPLDPRPATDEALQAQLEQLRERHGLEAIEVGVFDAADSRLLGSGTTSEPLLPGEAASLLAGLALVALDADGTLSLDAEVLALAPELDIRNRWSERPVRIAD